MAHKYIHEKHPLEALLEKHKISRAKLCHYINISRKTIDKRFKDPYSWTVGELVLMAYAFGMNVKELFNVLILVNPPEEKATIVYVKEVEEIKELRAAEGLAPYGGPKLER